MKLKFGITFKVILIVVLASLLVVSAQVVTNYYDTQSFFNQILNEHSEVIFKALDAYIKDVPLKNNSENLSEILNDFLSLNNNILLINIYLFEGGEVGRFKLYGTSTPQSVYNTSSFKKFNLYTSLALYEYTNHKILQVRINGSIYSSSIPISYEDEDGIITNGTYGMVIDFTENYANLERRILNQMLFSFALIILSSIMIIYGIRKSFTYPLIKLKKITEVYAKGNLDQNVVVKSRDEIGDLANSFNKMAKDLKESRDKIHDYNRILENLLKQKDEFIGQLGHDLKNPLQPLIGLLPLLIEKEKDPKIKEALEVMNQNATFMHELIYDTLNLAKLRHSNIQFDIETLNLYGEIEKVINSQKILLNENNVEIINTINKGIMVQADKLRLVEVFNNLIANSVKYKKENQKGNIFIDAEIDQNKVKISLKDDGVGIKEDEINQIFDEFYKADTFSSERKSSGLGLNICKRIIEKHGGKIWVESLGLGKGSTFYFTLKLAKGVFKNGQ